MSFKGNKAFSQCQVKIIEYKDFVYAKGDSGLYVISKNPSEDARTAAGHSAVLHCPRTEDDRVNAESEFTNHPTRLDAMKSLRQNAAAMLCANCVFSTMDGVAVARHRANIYRAETDRLEALTSRTQAIAELAEIDPAYKQID